MTMLPMPGGNPCPMTDAIPATAAPLRADPRCRNCGSEAPGKYCPECGQETSLHPPSVGEFVNQFLGNYIAVRSTLAQTLWVLVSQPGQLTMDYLAGRKRRYVLPFRLYLTVSIVTLLLISLFAGLDVAEPVKLDAKPNGTIISLNGTELKYVDGRFVCSGLPDRACAHLRKRFDHSPGELQAMFADMPQRMLKFWGYAMFVLLPMFALLLKLVYRRRGLVYGEHLVFALHLHTFWLLAVGALVLMPGGTPDLIGVALFFAIPLHALLAMRRVYGGRWWPRLLRAAFLSLMYAILMLLMLFAVTVVALLA
jgi:hypothetical protein